MTCIYDFAIMTSPHRPTFQVKYSAPGAIPAEITALLASTARTPT